MVGNAENIGNVPPASFSGIQFLKVNCTSTAARRTTKAARCKAKLAVRCAVLRGKTGGAKDDQLASQRLPRFRKAIFRT